jgi:glycosyltransferase involved in cell wall biosynthesis
MRILLVNHEFTISGASLMLYRVARHLLSRGFAVDVFPCLPTEGPLAAMYAAAGIAVVQRVKASLYRLCIANTVYSGSIVAQLGGAIPTVWWIHEGENGLETVLTDVGLYDKAFRAAARVVFPARHLADNVYRSFVFRCPEEKLVVLPNGLDLPDRIEAVDNGTAFRVVSVGSVYLRKRQGDVLEALDALDLPDAEAVFIGRLDSISERGRAILEKDRQRGAARFRFLGELPNEHTLAWLASADVFVHPAGAEANPLAPLEAGLLGKPIVLADIEVYEGIWQHGRNCLMHPLDDAAVLAAQLWGLHRDPGLRRRLGERARETAKRFSGRAFLDQFDARVLSGLL